MTKQQEFSEEVLPHLKLLYSSANRLMNNRDDADELVQETLMRAYINWDKYKSKTNCGGWLATILHNAAMDIFRKGERTPVNFTDYLERSGIFFQNDESDIENALFKDKKMLLPNELLFNKTTVEHIMSAIDKLPEAFKITATMGLIDGKNGAEIARELNIPLGTVKSRLSRSKKMIVRELE